jgi:hypothetical protein
MLIERPKVIKVKTPNEFLRLKIGIFGDGLSYIISDDWQNDAEPNLHATGSSGVLPGDDRGGLSEPSPGTGLQLQHQHLGLQRRFPDLHRNQERVLQGVDRHRLSVRFGTQEDLR